MREHETGAAAGRIECDVPRRAGSCGTHGLSRLVEGRHGRREADRDERRPQRAPGRSEAERPLGENCQHGVLERMCALADDPVHGLLGGRIEAGEEVVEQRADHARGLAGGERIRREHEDDPGPERDGGPGEERCAREVGAGRVHPAILAHVLAIGLVYDLLGTHPRAPGDPCDVDAEYEPEATVAALEAAIVRLGHRPVRIGSAHALLGAAGKGELPHLDAALSIAEGYGSRSRESWAPVLLEMLGIPCLGSDALTLATSLDKLWAKERVARAGVPIAAGVCMGSAEEARSAALPGPYPLFVKPRWEGTAKGIGPRSRVETRDELVAAVTHVVETYRQPALVEVFVGGAEFTVTVVGHRPPRALAVLQRAIESTTRIGLHALERHPAPGRSWAFELPGTLDPRREAQLQTLALRAFDALECRDFARADFRLGTDAEPLFLEINPLPTFAPDGSFGILAELEGRPHDALLADVIREALQRLGLVR